MEKRKLGSAGPEVPVICLGGNVFGWTVAEADGFRLLDAALNAGLNFIDTADVYSRWVPGHKGGESETIIGKWLARTGKRKNVIVATKVGMDMGDGKKGLKAGYIHKRSKTRCADCRLTTLTSIRRIRTTRIPR